MKKLVQGILEFRRNVFPAYRMTFSRLATGQSPDCLFVGCADSRVVPNLFASTQPGDLFVVRNVGNMVPACLEGDTADREDSVAAALEFAAFELNVTDIVICGHSSCGAMKALIAQESGEGGALPPHLTAWLKNGAPALARHRGGPVAITHKQELPEHDRLALANVLAQLDHLRTHPFIKERVDQGKLRLHGWWFDISTADVYAYEPDEKAFLVIDEAETERILERIAPGSSKL